MHYFSVKYICLKKISVYLLLVITSLTTLRAQQLDSAQLKAATIYLNAVLAGDNRTCWNLFNQDRYPEESHAVFNNDLFQLTNSFRVFSSFELFMYGMRSEDSTQMNIYSFKPVSKQRNLTNDILIEVSFVPGSALVCDVRPRERLKEASAVTTQREETQLEGPFPLELDGASYQVRGVNLVHFTGDKVMLVIQVEHPSNIEENEATRNDAEKFARYLMKHGYMDKAMAKAKEMHKTLLSDIAVSLYQPSLGQGINILFPPDELK